MRTQLIGHQWMDHKVRARGMTIQAQSFQEERFLAILHRVIIEGGEVYVKHHDSDGVVTITFTKSEDKETRDGDGPEEGTGDERLGGDCG